MKEEMGRNEENRNSREIQNSGSSILTSTPKDSKCTQTSRPSSPVMSPITQNGMQELQLNVPYNGTSSSTSFDLENAGTRIQQLAASDSDDVDCKNVETQENEFSVCKCIYSSVLKLANNTLLVKFVSLTYSSPR